MLVLSLQSSQNRITDEFSMGSKGHTYLQKGVSLDVICVISPHCTPDKLHYKLNKN